VDRRLFGHAPLERAQIRGGDRLVTLNREEKRDVDINPFKKELFDGWNAFGRAGYLDEQIRARHRLPEAARFGDGALSVAREKGRHLEADKTVAPFGAIVNGAQDVAGIADVRDDQCLINAARRLCSELPDLRIVVVTLAERRVEDCRVVRDAGESFFRHPPLEIPALDHLAAKVIDPVTLAELSQLEQRVHRSPSMSFIAFSTTFSTVKP
jgi:hypothetical protein